MLKNTGKFEIPYFIYRIDDPSIKEQILDFLDKTEGRKSLTEYENISKLDWYSNNDENYFQKNFVDSESNNYYKILKPYLDKILKDLEKTDNHVEFRVRQGWFHQYKKMNYYGYHNHLGARWAMIYYVELPPDGPKTEFENFFGEPIKIDIREGDILVFAGWLRHRSPPNLSTKRKTILSFNVGEYKKLSYM